MSTQLDGFSDAAELSTCSKLEQATRIGWFLEHSIPTKDFTVGEINNALDHIRLPRGNPTRLRNALRTSTDTVKGTRVDSFRVGRDKARQLDEDFGHLLESPPLTPCERANIDQSPMLTPEDVDSARKMAELYVIIHCYENSARKVVGNALEGTLGKDWWDKAANTQMQKKVEERKRKEEKNRWITPRGDSPLFYVDWGDLLSLIRKYEGVFASLFPDYPWVESRFAELERFRNIVAHNGALPSEEDFDHVVLSFKQWCKQLPPIG